MQHAIRSSFTMPYCILLLLLAVATQASVYLPSSIQEEHLLGDMQRREILDQMVNEFIDAANSYVEYLDNSRLSSDYEKAKEIPVESPIDYDGVDTFNPNPSIRDQEYLQHSTLWSYQHGNENYKGNNRHKIQAGLKSLKDEKTENALPAYCTPPNPCPVGYTSENNCLMDFENTAAFSRHYQSVQDCMCDTEHMLDCSTNSASGSGLSGIRISNSDFDQIVEELQENPFFHGEKLPIAAKKGINVAY